MILFWEEKIILIIDFIIYYFHEYQKNLVRNEEIDKIGVINETTSSIIIDKGNPIFIPFNQAQPRIPSYHNE